MKAVRIHSHGALSHLHVEQVDVPAFHHGDVRVRIEAAALNQSDLASLRGAFTGSPLPRVLGRDFAGIVEDGPRELVGMHVWGSGGDLGVARDGSHAEYLVVPRAAVSERPKNLTAEQAACVGVPFVTAWLALELTEHIAGETVLIAPASGSVGTAMVQMVRATRSRVIAVVRDPSHAPVPDGDRAVMVAYSSRPSFAKDLSDLVLEATSGRGCQVALCGLSGSVFEAVFASLADRGRLAVYASQGGSEAPVDLSQLYRKRIRILGLNIATADAVQCADILRRFKPLFESGAFRALPIAARFSFTEARRAYEALNETSGGKIVLVP